MKGVYRLCTQNLAKENFSGALLPRSQAHIAYLLNMFRLR